MSRLPRKPGHTVLMIEYHDGNTIEHRLRVGMHATETRKNGGMLNYHLPEEHRREPLSAIKSWRHVSRPVS